MKVSIFGSGAWGTAIANVLAYNKHTVTLHYRDIQSLEYHNQTKRHPALHASLHENIITTLNHEDILLSNIIFVAIPVQKFREAIIELINSRPIDMQSHILVSCSKGIESSTSLFPSEIIKTVIPNAKVAVISGPNFANDVAQLSHAKTTIAAYNRETAQEVANLFRSSSLITDISLDPKGVEICGALKNVYSIGAGLMQGYNCSKSTITSYLTAALIELNSVLQTLGDTKTMISPAGIGDFILTCTNHESRNYKFGMNFATDNSNFKKMLDNNAITVEGYHTVKIIAKWSQKHSLSMPICSKIFNILYNSEDTKSMIQTLKFHAKQL